MLRIAVLGAGSHSSSNHGPALQHCRDERPEAIELAAVCDLDADKGKQYAERFGFHEVYTDLDEMAAAEDLDGIVAVTPLTLTAELAAQVPRIGIPFVIEKPPGHTVEAALQLRDAVADSGVPHMVSFNRRFGPAFARARAWLAEQGLGHEPHLVISRMLRHDRREETFVFDTGIHAVDTVLAFMGQPVQAESHSHPVSSRETDFFDARITFTGGGAATFLFAPACGRSQESIEIIGDDYDIQVDVGACAIEIRERDETVLEWRAPATMPDYERAGALDETRAFIRCLETGAGWWPTMEDALWSVRAAEAIQRGGEASLGE